MSNSTVATAPHVYQAISNVMSMMAKEGIGKDRNNAQQGYKFRGIDDIYASLCSKLCEAGLLLLPSYGRHVVAEAGTTKSGNPIYRAVVSGDFTFLSVKDGSSHTVSFTGEAFDSADKATNKAMSAAYKYAALQVFCIPTEGDNDADASHHEVAKTKPAISKDDVVIVEGYKKQIETASSVDDLLEIAKKMKTESDAIKAQLRQPYKERELAIANKAK